MNRIDINTNITNIVKKYLTSFSESIVSRFYSKSDIDNKIANIDTRSEIGSQLDYGIFTRSTDLTISSINSVIVFDESNGSNMILSTNGRPVLKSGKKYSITFSARTIGISSSGGIDFGLYDYTNSKQINLSVDSHSSNPIYIETPGKTYYCPTSDCEIGMNITYFNSTNVITLPSYACYIEIQEVGRTVVLDPAQQIDKDTGIQDMPVGHIMSYMGLKAPEHYLICDGTKYNIQDYPKLAEYFLNEFGSIKYFGGDGINTFAVPDMRGEFIRGYDNNAARDPNGKTRGIGKHQDATQHMNFMHCVGSNYNNLDIFGSSVSVSNKDSDIAVNSTDRYIQTNGTGTLVNVAALYTSRPTNVNVLFCIKFEPTYFMNYSPQYAGFETENVFSGKANAVGVYSLTDEVMNYQMLKVIYEVVNSVGTTIQSNYDIMVDEIVYGKKYQFIMALSKINCTSHLTVSFANDESFQIDDMYLKSPDDVSFTIKRIIGFKAGTTLTNDFTVTDAEADATITQVWNEVEL